MNLHLLELVLSIIFMGIVLGYLAFIFFLYEAPIEEEYEWLLVAELRKDYNGELLQCRNDNGIVLTGRLIWYRPVEDYCCFASQGNLILSRVRHFRYLDT